MQAVQSEIHSGIANPSQLAQSAGSAAVAPGTASGVNLADYEITRRNGAMVNFEPSEIAVTMTKASLTVNGGQGAASVRVHELIDQQTQNVACVLLCSRSNGGTLHIEDVQDQVELTLVCSGKHDVARAYVLYRERRTQERAQAGETQQQPAFIGLNVTDGGISRPLDIAALCNVIVSACEGPGEVVDSEPILKETVKNPYEDVPVAQVYDSATLASRTLIGKDPAYGQVTTRILLHTIRREILDREVTQAEMNTRYVDYFPQFIERDINAELLDDKLAQFDLARLGAVLDASRDFQFNYLGLQTLYDRYFLHISETRIEMPQAFFIRVAMGLALNEIDREARAIEFYQLLSSFDFMSSTPTLFNSGTRRSWLSSCYLTTVSDDLDGIYEALKENALLSKFADGLGNDWTNTCALGSHIKGTNGKSQSVVPFLKIVNDTAVAVNQGGKCKGAICTCLETWHLDIEEFLELRRNTGDDHHCTHDMNMANWIPDLFMKRVTEGGEWTLFPPSTCPSLRDKVGKAFEQAYLAYEDKVARGEIKFFKKMPALQLWRRMLGMLFEIGHPWIVFKGPCNIRSPQQHVGVVHSSNLCTEITLSTNDSEIVVCNLGSANLVVHLVKRPDGSMVLDHEKLKRTVRTATRILDNVIDIDYYAVKKTRDSDLRHRLVGMGIMGFQDALHVLRVPYTSEATVQFADTSVEAVCYYAYWASTELVEERGRHSSYKSSLWDRGILSRDSLKLLVEERGGCLEAGMSSMMGWDNLRGRIKQYDMRNSSCVAIAPTATISNIISVSACIEPTYRNLYIKSNLSSEFTMVNDYLMRDLRACGLWDEVMIADLRYFDGSLTRIDRIPQDLHDLYAMAFEVEPQWLVEAALCRQKWIDQAQSLNIYMAGASGKKLNDTYKLAWLRGLKTTYYLRTIGATHVGKSTVSRGTLNVVSSGSDVDGVSAAGASGMISAAPTSALDAAAATVQAMPEAEGAVCTMRPGDPSFEECETCQ